MKVDRLFCCDPVWFNKLKVYLQKLFTSVYGEFLMLDTFF